MEEVKWTLKTKSTEETRKVQGILLLKMGEPFEKANSKSFSVGLYGAGKKKFSQHGINDKKNYMESHYIDRIELLCSHSVFLSLPLLFVLSSPL